MRRAILALASLALCSSALAGDIISTNGFSVCQTGDSTIQVQNVDISFDRSTNKITFNVAGKSDIEQNVVASLVVQAYGVQVYNQTFDPCASDTKVDQLCPVPAGQFSAQGEQEIPSEYASKIPSIAYTIPDLDGTAKMVLSGKDGAEAACIQSSVTNGKSVELPAVQGVAAAIAAGALVLSGASAALAGGKPGVSHSSPGFMEVMWWFQGMAMDGMYTVNYPGIYRSYTKNFAFSTGLVSWGSMQTSIDNFRKSTGGNLTDSSYAYLKNATLRYQDGSTASPSGSFRRLALRSLDYLLPRQVSGITTSVNGTSSNTTSNSQESEFVSGIKAYTEQLTVPDTNAFMTILLVFAIVIGVIVVGILLFKVILEAWSLFGKFPKSLTTFRKEYWRVMATTITSLVLLLYGVWTLYCIFQFRKGDSWAAKLLAGVTLGLFTALLAFYSWKIWVVARKLKKMQGSASALYENKETWKKYKLFYENYKTQYWWLFMPFIIYMFAKGCVLAAYHIMIESLAKIRQYEIVWDLVNCMNSKGMLNIETFCIIMRKYARAQKVDEAIYTFNIMKKYNVPPNLAAFNGLLSALCKSKNVRKAQEIFDGMKNQYLPDSKTYSILLEGWGRAPNLPKAREIFKEMVDTHCPPDIVTYGIMVDILCKAGRTDEAVQVVKEMEFGGCQLTSFIYSVLIHTYGIENRIEDAVNTFFQMGKNRIKPDVAVYNALISAFCKANKFQNAYKVVAEMDDNGVRPNSRTCNILMSGLMNRGESDQAIKVFCKLSKICEPDADTYTMMIKMFCEREEFEMALRVWRYMKNKQFAPGMHTFSALVNGFINKADVSRACVLMEEMIERGLRPGRHTFGKLRQLLLKEGRNDVLEFLQEKMNLLVKDPLYD